MKRSIYFIIALLAFSAGNLFAQHRGDELSFQGLTTRNDGGLQAKAMGSAYTAMSGTIDNLFHNAAGLSALKHWTFAINANYYQKEWWENQVYRPDRYFVTLPFYLEGLYVPDPANNGVLDRDLALDSNYVVNSPQKGYEVSSKEAADWIRKKQAPQFNSFSLAIPLHILNHAITFAGSYFTKNTILDFDRNDTYLQPHVGYSGYGGFIPRVNGKDTLNVQWFRYLRQRTGSMQSVRMAMAVQATKRFSVGLTVNYDFGKSNDLLQMNKMGYFGLVDENKFFFTYDTLNYAQKGDSKFSSISGEIGLLYQFDHVAFGVNITLPQTFKRKWEYGITSQTASERTQSKMSGEDRFEIPAIYRFGVKFAPIEKFTFAIDYRYAPYSQGTFKLGHPDSTFRKWVNEHDFMTGIQYRPVDYLFLMAGFRWQPSVFVPDGSSFHDHGPEVKTFTFGAQLNFGQWGSIILAHEMSWLKYHDTYFSNTNYATENYSNLSIGYVLKF